MVGGLVANHLQICIHRRLGLEPASDFARRESLFAGHSVLVESLVAGKCLHSRHGTRAQMLHLEEFFEFLSRILRTIALGLLQLLVIVLLAKGVSPLVELIYVHLRAVLVYAPTSTPLTTVRGLA